MSRIHGNQSGLDGDRQWVVLGGGDNVLTQRDYASMALIQPTLLNENGYKLKLEAPNMPPIKVEHCEDKDRLCEIDIWDNDRVGYDQGDAVASWISDYLKTEARLLYTKVDRSQDARYVDCCPLLVISEESLS
ncbi:MAG: MOSC N-terminal beta barrel domain-containing protein, partial [Candidatus Melainabacteria bacterium]|nr:MOSC N-terminal beta barrel domain-containing protein [Candidatus Melainabacteria bacterium]